MSDLIDRQAAIDALGDEPEVWVAGDGYTLGRRGQWQDDYNALKALPSAQSEQMSNDLISRKAAIDKKVLLENWAGQEYQAVIVEDIETLTSAQPKQRWIPVTERLPELGEKVLVSTKNTVFTQVFKRIYGTPDRWGWEHHTIKKVTAWMPLPEPYKEGDDAEVC